MEIKQMNEPVAWMDGEGGFYHNDDYEVCKEHNIADDLIPLYTHPVSQYKAITNTKIEPTVVSYTYPVKELPTKEDEYWLMVEVLRAKVREQQAEIEVLKDKLMLAKQSLEIVEGWIKK